MSNISRRQFLKAQVSLLWLLLLPVFWLAALATLAPMSPMSPV
mgnify:FL=1